MKKFVEFSAGVIESGERVSDTGTLVVVMEKVAEAASPTSSKAVTVGEESAELGTVNEHPSEAGRTPRLPDVLSVVQVPLVETELPAK